jgi:PAS domain S-box-containing protein
MFGMLQVSTAVPHADLGRAAAQPCDAVPSVDPSEERYRLAMRAANDIIWDWDARTDASVWSGAMQALLGHDPDEAASAPGGAYTWWLSHLHPDDRERVVGSYAAALASAATEWAAEYRFLRADGSYATISDRACIARDERGAVRRVVGAMHDVSDRAAREVQYQRLAEAERSAREAAERTLDRMRRLHAITAALGEAKSEADVLDVSVTQASAALGATGGIFALVRPGTTGSVPMLEVVRVVAYPANVLTQWRRFPIDAENPLATVARTGAPLFFRTPAERAAMFPVFARALPAGYASAAMIPVVAEGAVRGALALSFAEPQQFPDEDCEFLLAVAQQCGQALLRARLYDAEHAARADAERANRAKMDFLATMSHELRTPLNAIGGYAELMELGIHGPVTSEQIEDLHRIQRSQRHLLSLINDVLHFAKIEAGTITLRIDAVPLRPLLAGLEPLLAPQLRAKRIAFAWRCDDEALSARADEDKVRQIALNLLANAVKFTPLGGTVSIEAAACDGGVALHVRDTGVGIEGEHLERIFDPFVQVERGLANPVEGTGLGLAISRDLAHAMHGDLTVSSVPGEGSTFTLTLPVA